MAEDLSATLEKLDGKRAKIKTLEEVPTDTKGKKLDPAIKKAIEEKFPKAKLQNVRVHSGGGAKDACKTLGVKAFASGNDIFFASPGFAKDKQLIAHELTHVIQQGKGKMPKPQKGKVLTSK